jgi:hypothetical protein
VAGAMDAQRDLAAIGDQHLLEHLEKSRRGIASSLRSSQ